MCASGAGSHIVYRVSGRARRQQQPHALGVVVASGEVQWRRAHLRDAYEWQKMLLRALAGKAHNLQQALRVHLARNLEGCRGGVKGVSPHRVLCIHLRASF